MYVRMYVCMYVSGREICCDQLQQHPPPPPPPHPTPLLREKVKHAARTAFGIQPAS